MKKYKKYIYLVFVLVILGFMLKISYSIDEISQYIEFFGNVYGAKTAESSISTKQSSTKNKENKEVSSDMIDLLARVINGEARGEPYLRSSGCWSSYYE